MLQPRCADDLTRRGFNPNVCITLPCRVADWSLVCWFISVIVYLNLQVFVSNSEGTSPMIGDGYTGGIDEFSGSIDLMGALAAGSNRISITTIYNKCSADKVGQGCQALHPLPATNSIGM